MHGTRPRSSNAISSKDSMLGAGEVLPGRLCSAVPVMPAVVMPAGAARTVVLAVPSAASGVAAPVMPAVISAGARAVAAGVGLAHAEHLGPGGGRGGRRVAAAPARQPRARGSAGG